MGRGQVERYEAEIDRRIKNRPFGRASIVIMKAAEVRAQAPWENKDEFAGRCLYRTSKLDLGIFAGVHMEKTDEQIKVVAEEIAESKKALQSAFNDLAVLSEQLNPMIKEQVNAIRTARMTVVAETSAALVSMKDVRRFFLDSDYEKEMKRLGEFVALCKELKRLKEDGTLDVLCDAAIKLAIREVQP